MRLRSPFTSKLCPSKATGFIAPIAANGHIADPALSAAPVPSPPPKKPHWKILGAAIALIAFVGAGALFRITQPPAARQPAAYTQITSFTDAAVDPVLSPDGRMVAFYRSERGFFTSDQIYAKMLPDGEPVQLTHDPRLKYNSGIFAGQLSNRVHGDGKWMAYLHRLFAGRRLDIIPPEFRGPDLARPAPVAVFGRSRRACTWAL